MSNLNNPCHLGHFITAGHRIDVYERQDGLLDIVARTGTPADAQASAVSAYGVPAINGLTVLLDTAETIRRFKHQAATPMPADDELATARALGRDGLQAHALAQVIARGRVLEQSDGTVMQ